MNVLALIFALVVAALVQALLPATRWTGYAPVPVMASVVVYYALLRPRPMLLAAAVGAGLVEDSLGQMPLGYSVFCYCVVGLVIEHVRDSLLVRQWTTHVTLGLLVNLGVTLAVLLLLAKDGLIVPDVWHTVLRLGGAMLLGAVTAPFIFALLEHMDQTLGMVDEEADA
jgi:cell shape-determining protein MreD